MTHPRSALSASPEVDRFRPGRPSRRVAVEPRFRGLWDGLFASPFFEIVVCFGGAR